MVVRRRPEVVDRGPIPKKKRIIGNLKAKQFHHELILDKTASLYLRGQTLAEIGTQFNPPVTAKTVCLWVAEIRERWKKSALVDYDDRKNQELAKLDLIEREAYEAWERSKLDAVTNRKVVTKGLKKGEDGGDAELKVVGTLKDKTAKGQTGNPAFLAQMERCVEMRCRIFGLAKAGEVHLTQNNNTLNVGTPSWDELMVSPSKPDVVREKLAQLPIHVEDSK